MFSKKKTIFLTIFQIKNKTINPHTKMGYLKSYFVSWFLQNKQKEALIKHLKKQIRKNTVPNENVVIC